jgi:hypothetical protein
MAMRQGVRQERRAPSLARFEKPILVMMAAAGVYLAYQVLSYYLGVGALVSDGRAYWLVGQDWYQPYVIAPAHLDAFLYSPAFAQAVTPLTWLPWPLFALTWVILEGAAFAWLFRPLGWAWTLVLLLWCSPELVMGNILGFVAVATVLAITRSSAAWALPILTKPTFGLGALWHGARGEWRRCAVAVGSTLAIVAVSFAIDPGMWMAWVRYL